VPALGKVLQNGAHGAFVVEQDLARRRGSGHTLADAHGRDALGDLAPALRKRFDRRDDEGVDATVVELEGELDLQSGIAVGIGDQQLPATGPQVALDAGHQLLQIEIGEAADHHAHAGGRAAAQRAGDRIGAEAELLGRGLHTGLRLLGHLQAAQRVRNRRLGEACVLGQLANRRSPRARGPLFTHSRMTVLDERRSRRDDE
jgi:hypothetical protein